jgi:hypothetical protein
MNATTKTKSLTTRFAILALMLVVLVMPSEVSQADDTFLFRVQSGKPYVYVVFDTSSSMNLSAELGGLAVDRNGDDPRSTFYQAKSAVYEVFNKAYLESGDFIHFGFMSYNQDGMRVKGKHWLYAFDGGNHVHFGDQHYPQKIDDQVELLTFGADLPTTATPDPDIYEQPADGFLGTCDNPIPFSANRGLINRFPKLHPVDFDDDGYMDSMLFHRIYLEEDGRTYALYVSKHSNADKNFLLGETDLLVDFTVIEATAGCTVFTEIEKATVPVKLVGTYLMHDQLGVDNASDLNDLSEAPASASYQTTNLKTNSELMAMRSGNIRDSFDFNPSSAPTALRAPRVRAPGDGGGPGTRSPEAQDGIWHYQDYSARAVCGDDSHPFTGTGGESNYDGGTFVGDPANYPLVDPFSCPGGDCETLKHETELNPNPDPEWRTLDIGDMLPYHWERTNRDAFFKRLAPDWAEGDGVDDVDFGIANYFKDVPNSNGFLELKDPAKKPLMAFGDSPVGEALVDWRCFYLGTDQGGNKCRDTNQPFGRGWDWLAPQYDLEWGCRKPYIIVIGDGENNCDGENPAADTANLRRNRIKAWVLNFGGPEARDLRPLAQNTGGEYIEVDDRDELVAELENILGLIVEETKAFASAVVPTVQAEEADKVFVSNFKPLNQEPVWPGNIQAFLKPVPIDGAGRPDASIVCADDPDSDPASSCFLWNTGEEILDQVDPGQPTNFGTNWDQRRVYYTRLSESGDWPNNRRYLQPTIPEMDDANAIRYDLWRGFGLILPTVADGDLDEADELVHEANANTLINGMMSIKTDDNDTPSDLSDDIDYVLGDIFHSDPLIVGSPVNSKFFALNLEDNGDTCEDGNPGYRCFFRKHENRRKIVLVGANDGEVHAADAGIYRTSGDFEDGFDRGSGKEVFAFTPRSVMPTMDKLFRQGINRGSGTWSVDGGIVGIDAFIDPVKDNALFPNEDDREWRTIVMGGLRRGGKSFYALDVTQPDEYNIDGEPKILNDYVPSCSNGGGDCGPIPYPAQLWEFSDSILTGDPLREIPFDQDFDGVEDLAQSWSTPNLGIMKVCVSDNCDETALNHGVEDRYVAIFGGGVDPGNKNNHTTGNFLYIVDIETGKAIYKRELLDVDGVTNGGYVAAEPAAIDSDGDGYLDRVYVATLRGYIYRIDLRGAANEIPKIEDTSEFIKISSGLPAHADVQRITDNNYRPRLIFKAQENKTTPAPNGRAIYFRPSVIFSAALGHYALAFGTGDREDLWSSDGSRGLFYMMKDDIAVGDFTTYYTEENLDEIDSEVVDSVSDDLLTNPGRAGQGWHMILRENERMITSPFAVSGVVVFTVFNPDVEVDLQDLTCSRTGRSRIFGVTATNGNGLLYTDGNRTRYFDIADFVTEPYVEQAQTKNPDSGNNGQTADDLTVDNLAVMEELKKLFPTNCKFANYRLDIKTLSSDTGIHLIAPVPICIVEKNWKEF